MVSHLIRRTIRVCAKRFGGFYKRPIEYDTKISRLRWNGPWYKLPIWSFLTFIWLPFMAIFPAIGVLLKNSIHTTDITVIEKFAAILVSSVGSSVLFFEVFFYTHKEITLTSCTVFRKLEGELKIG